MVFVDLRIFARRMAHVYVAGSTFHLKGERSCKPFHLASNARTVRMDIDEKEIIIIITLYLTTLAPTTTKVDFHGGGGGVHKKYKKNIKERKQDYYYMYNIKSY